jgi:hypothetical protein
VGEKESRGARVCEERESVREERESVREERESVREERESVREERESVREERESVREERESVREERESVCAPSSLKMMRLEARPSRGSGYGRTRGRAAGDVTSGDAPRGVTRGGTCSLHAEALEAADGHEDQREAHEHHQQRPQPHPRRVLHLPRPASPQPHPTCLAGSGATIARSAGPRGEAPHL